MSTQTNLETLWRLPLRAPPPPPPMPADYRRRPPPRPPHAAAALLQTANVRRKLARRLPRAVMRLVLRYLRALLNPASVFAPESIVMLGDRTFTYHNERRSVAEWTPAQRARWDMHRRQIFRVGPFDKMHPYCVMPDGSTLVMWKRTDKDWWARIIHQRHGVDVAAECYRHFLPRTVWHMPIVIALSNTRVLVCGGNLEPSQWSEDSRAVFVIELRRAPSPPTRDVLLQSTARIIAYTLGARVWRTHTGVCVHGYYNAPVSAQEAWRLYVSSEGKVERYVFGGHAQEGDEPIERATCVGPVDPREPVADVFRSLHPFDQQAK